MTSDVLTVEAAGRRWQLHDPGQHIGRIIRESGRPYEAAVLAAMALVYRPGTWAVDVGAHVGNHTLYLALVCDAPVLAAEPSPVNFARLRANLELNPTAVVDAHEVALAGEPGWATFDHADPADVTWGKAPVDLLTERGPITVTTLDELWRSVLSPPVSVVKVDVEGLEPDVLAGATELLTSEHPELFLEAQDRAAEDRNAAALAGTGYRRAAVLNRRRTPVEHWTWTR